MDKKLQLCCINAVSIRIHPCFNLVVTRKNDAISRLCPACGLCCNGVLFGDVELQRTDDAKQLQSMGLELLRKGRKTAFSQPCSCFNGGLCGIYGNRPKQCRAFECGLLKRVNVGKCSSGKALRTIVEVRRQVDAVLNLVRKLGNLEEQKPLNQLYASVVAQPIDMSDDEAKLEWRGELMMAVAKLVDSLKRDFLS